MKVVITIDRDDGRDYYTTTIPDVYFTDLQYNKTRINVLINYLRNRIINTSEKVSIPSLNLEKKRALRFVLKRMYIDSPSYHQSKFVKNFLNLSQGEIEGILYKLLEVDNYIIRVQFVC